MEGFNFSDCVFISGEKDQSLRKGKLNRYDIVLTTRGTVGNVAFYDESVPYDNIRINSGMVIFRPSEKIEPRYLYLFLKSDLFQHQVKSHLTGSAQPQLPIRDINILRFTLPPLSEQKRIAEILGSLDDKIELNRKQNETLEAMARAVFQSWFVDFDPVIDNALAAGRPIPDELAERAARRKHHKTKHPLPQAIQSLFPDRFDPSPLGPIPKGWKVGKLGDISLNIRKPARLDTIDPESVYIGLEHMPQKCIALSEWGKAGEVASNKFEFKEGQILFGKLRPYFHKVGVAVTDGICSTDILVVEPKAEKWFGVILSYLSSDALIEYATSHSSGTRMPRTNWHDLAKYPIAIATDEISRHFKAMFADYVNMLKTNINESNTLTHLRDSLLPKLLTGEIEA